jgi:DNA-binding phage protein
MNEAAREVELLPWDAADYLDSREAVELYLADAIPSSDSLDEIRRHLETALRALTRIAPAEAIRKG